MSFFKFWGSSSSGKTKTEKAKDAHKQSDYGLSKEELEEAGKIVPAFRTGVKADRNLSISRSGRHKMKQTRSQITTDLFNQPRDSQWNGQTSSQGGAGLGTGAASGDGGNYSGQKATNYAPTSSTQSKGQGSVGRVSGAGFSIPESSTVQRITKPPPQRSTGISTAV